MHKCLACGGEHSTTTEPAPGDMTISYTVSTRTIAFPSNMARIVRRLRRRRTSLDCRDRQRRYAKNRRFFRIVVGFSKATPFNIVRLHQAAIKLKEMRTSA